jgi:DHA2 family multidrug resistance protein
MMGYSAKLAGMALSPGGFTVMMLMPLVGNLIGRVDARKMLAVGFTLLSLSLFYMAHTLYVGLDFKHVMLLRVYQSCGLAFMFVPINTLVYVGVPPEKNNSVSGIVNLSRNMGGDIGIAAVTTLLARRSQVHQNNLVAHADPFSTAYDSAVRGIAASLQRSGSSPVDATRRALAVVYRQLFREALTLSYVDVLFMMACATACMLPLLFLLKKNPLGGKAQMGH